VEPSNLRFGGGIAETALNPAVALVVLVAGILICCLPRRKAMVPFLAASILLPTDQVLVLGGVHFPMLRLLVLFGLIRMIRAATASNGALLNGGLRRLDTVLVWFSVLSAVAALLLWQQWGTFVYELGELYTALGTYFLLRFLIHDRQDVERMIRVLAWIVVVNAAVMTYEQARGWNPYALLGGARAYFYASAMEREGRFRATGAFAHPILAGTFAAVLVPMFLGLWWIDKKHRRTAVMGMVGAALMIVASNSSTPITALMAGLLGLCLWPLRRQMRLIRWGIVVTLVSLHIVMKAPVWHLISRVDLSGGSSSYHRYELVNQFIRHFWDWWLIGVKSNADWGWDMWDTANQYVSVGQTSGLLPFILFLAIIAYGFKYLGRARQLAASRKEALFLWALGSALFAHAVGFFGISYFDQTIVVWYGMLATICAVVTNNGKKEMLRAEPREDLRLAVAYPDAAPDLAGIVSRKPATLSSMLDALR
jgi:hypothetical protein